MVFPSCKILIITMLCGALIALNCADPVSITLLAAVVFFSFSKGHLAVLLIQMEMLALISVYSVFLAVMGNSPALFLALLLFTVIASEGGVGLAFLLKVSRHSSSSMEKSIV